MIRAQFYRKLATATRLKSFDAVSLFTLLKKSGFPVKQDFTFKNQMATPTCHLPFIDRTSTMQKLLCRLGQQWSVPTHSRRPLVAFQSGAGGGKSRFIDELVQFKWSNNFDHQATDAHSLEFWRQVREVEDPNIIAKFKQEWDTQTVFLPITFNGRMTWDPPAMKLDLAARLLYSYCVDFTNHSVCAQDFVDLIQHDTPIRNPYAAIRLITDHFISSMKIGEKHVRVVILVDELLKCDHPSKMLSLVCRLTDTRFPSVHSIDVIATTLEPELVNRERTLTNRGIRLLPLPSLRGFRQFFTPTEFKIACLFGGVCIFKY